jgi:hypothetical protein
MKVKVPTESPVYQALLRFQDRHPRGSRYNRFIRKGRIFGIRMGLRWRAVCENFLR